MIEWHFLRFRFLARPHFQIATVGTVQGRRNRGEGGYPCPPLPQILADQLTLYQSTGANYAHQITFRSLRPSYGPAER